MNWKRYLPIIGIAIFIYLILKLGIKQVLNEIININPGLFIIAIVFVFFLMITQTLKWFVIAKKQKINIKFWRAFKINLVGNFYGFVTPSKIGNIIRAEYLKKDANGIGKGVTNFVLDKVLDLVSLIILTAAFAFIFKDMFSLPIYVFGILAILIIGVFVFSKKERSKFFLRIIYKKVIPKKMQEKAKIAFDSFYEDMPGFRYFAMFIFFNLLCWVVAYIGTYYVGLSLGINLPLVYFLAILPLGTLVSLIPITIEGLGTREALLISLFGLFGIGAEKVFSMSILSLLITGILPSIIAIFLIFKKRDL